MAESTITSKGQTTGPLEIRRSIGAAPGTRLVWHLLPDGGLIVRAKNKSILDLTGSLKAPKGKRVAVDDMNAWIDGVAGYQRPGSLPGSRRPRSRRGCQEAHPQVRQRGTDALCPSDGFAGA